MAPSAALQAFFDSLKLARGLVDEEEQFPDPPDPPHVALVRGLRGGAAILMVAAFEEFLRSLFQERLSSLVAMPPVVEFAKLPKVTRVRSVFYSLEISMGNRGRHERGKRRVDRLLDIGKSAERIVEGRVDPIALSYMGSNPSPWAVSELFKALDVGEIFDRVRSEFDVLWEKREAGTFLRDKLDEIVRRRHVIAHSADALKITREQLREALLFLDCLARVLDGELARVVDGLKVSAAP
jgi:hypothetical protein